MMMIIQYWRVNENGDITTGVLHPTTDFGLATHHLSEVKGGDCHENAKTLELLLDNQLPEGHPILDFVLLNSAALLVIGGVASDFKDGVQKSRESIISGKAKSVLNAFREETCLLEKK